MNSIPVEMKDLSSVAAGARSVGLSARRVRALAARGKMTIVKLPGGRQMISVGQLRELVRDSTVWGSGTAR
jgi:hypothetical protein